MASVACDSPVRRFTTKQNKENSPVDVNRFKTLLKKQVGDDGSASVVSSASPKKAGTPRKEVKVKRGTTVKLCSSCADHNKDIDEVKNDGVEIKKKRITKKNNENQGQDANPADEKKDAVEKKAAVKKPKQTKKKAGTQGEMLDMPSTSGTTPSTTKATEPTDSGNQAEGESKPKRQRKNTEKSVQQAESSAEKEKKEKKPSGKAKKNIIKVKVAQPRKTAKKAPANNEKMPFENMNVTDLVTSIHHNEEAMQSAAEKSEDKSKTKKNNKELTVHFAPHSTSTDLLTDEHEIAENPSESKKKKNNADATTSKIPKLKKTFKKLPSESEKAPFESMDVTDLMNSIRQEEETTARKHNSIKQKPKQTDNVAPNSSLTSAKDNLMNLTSSRNYENKVVDNSEGMLENSSINRKNNNKDLMNFSSSIEAVELQMNEAAKTQADSSINRDISIDTMLHHEVHNPFDGHFSDFNLDLSDNPMPTQVMPGVSTGEKINLSASTNLSHDDITEGISMNVSNEINVTIENSIGKNSTLTSNIDALNIIDNAPVDSSIYHDITFPRESLPIDTFDNMSKRIVNVTLRTDKNRKDKNNVDAAQNISIDGVICFTQNDSNRAVADPAFNQNDETIFDENQQPSQADNEHLIAIKPEPAGNHDSDSSKSLPNPESSVPSDTHETSNLKKKSGKSASKSAEPKSKSKASKVSEPTEKKTKSAKMSKKNVSPKKASKESAKKLVIPSPPKSKKKSKDDETLWGKHKNVKKCDEKSARHTEMKKKLSKQLKNDLKVAKAIEGMSHHFSRISIGTTIGTIKELHIGHQSDSDSSDSSFDCPTDCSCDEFSSESSGDHCKCWRCLRKQEDANDSSEAESSSDEDNSSDESSSTDSSPSSPSSPPEEIRHPRFKKPISKREKIVKPTYKEKLSKFCSKYDLRSNNTSSYDLRSHDH